MVTGHPGGLPSLNTNDGPVAPPVCVPKLSTCLSKNAACVVLLSAFALILVGSDANASLVFTISLVLTIPLIELAVLDIVFVGSSPVSVLVFAVPLTELPKLELKLVLKTPLTEV
jgi:hypothetical protein